MITELIKKQRLLLALFLLIAALSGCSRAQADFIVPSAPPPPADSMGVHVIAPQDNENLRVGQPFTVRAEIVAPFKADAVIVTLWNPITRYEHKWKIDNPGASQRLTFQKTLIVPQTALPGDVYRLGVHAHPLFEDTEGGYTTNGFDVPVKVVDGREEQRQ